MFGVRLSCSPIGFPQHFSIACRKSNTCFHPLTILTKDTEGHYPGLTQRLFVASTGAVLDQCAVPERHAIEAATTIRTLECFPIHRTLVSRTGVFGRGYPRTGLRTKFHQ